MRRRLRGKTAVKMIQKAAEEEAKTTVEPSAKVQRIVEEELAKSFEDPPELASITFQLIAWIKKFLEKP